MKGIYTIIAVHGLFVASAMGQAVPSLFRAAAGVEMERWVDSVFTSLSEDGQIGQLFMPIIYPDDREENRQRIIRYVRDYGIGGVLFQKGKAGMQAEVTNLMQSTARVPLLVTLDGEWGLSMRLEGTERFPKNMLLGAGDNESLVEAYGKEVGRQCREMGIHVNFAPDMDVNSNADNPVIGLRSFGEDAGLVIRLGLAYARGLEAMGVLSVAKHFPGHGDTSEDSHRTLPLVAHDRQRLDSVELHPFVHYIKEGLGGMMTGHLRVPALENEAIASSFSYRIVTGLLQEQLGFNGLCFTDALEMKGAAAMGTNASVQALLAGNDILLGPSSLSTDFEAVRKAIQRGIIRREVIAEKCRKVLRYKYALGLDTLRPVQTEGLQERLLTPHAAWLAAKLNAEAMTLVKNEDDFFPLQDLGNKRTAVLSLGAPAGNVFQQSLSRYDSVIFFSLERTATREQVKDLCARISNYDRVICAVHTTRIPENEMLRQWAVDHPLALVFFTPPYHARRYKSMIKEAKAVLIAYEETQGTMDFAAQAVYGGVSVKGRLPVTVPGLFNTGTGIETEKTRLGYHEPEEAGVDPSHLALVDRLATFGLDTGAYPGCQLLVAKDGWVIYHKAFGYTDSSRLTAVTTNHIYDLASVTKATATLPALMKAYDENLFSLRRPLGDYLSFVAHTKKANILIRDMLYHRSGLPPTVDFFRDVLADSSLFSTSPYEGFTTQVARDFYLCDSFPKYIRRDILDARMRKQGRYVYSCVNFILLKMMFEEIKGTAMDEYLRLAFYAPLGANTTTYNPLRRFLLERIVPTENDRTVRKQVLQGFVHDEGAAFQGGVSGNAGLFSTANDLAKLLQLYLNEGKYGGESYLSAETLRFFTSNKSPNSRRGLGFDKPSRSIASSPCGHLAPPSTYGHTGYTGTCFWVDPDNQLIYIFLSNRVHPARTNLLLSHLDLRERIQDEIYKSFLH
jgi:beta-glucosidase-like glycosyl hydrolase/CubicO group peptidase (beta-lactamase class C family)